MPRLSPSTPTPDRALVKGLHDGDDSALAALYDEYGERLYDYVLSMSGDEKVAADIVHDTFIDAGRRAPRMRDHLQLTSWLYGAARRRCIRRGRTDTLFWDRDADFSDAAFLDRSEPDDPLPDWPPLDELHGLLRACLSRLEPVEQEVMVLAVRHGLRSARLGATLGLSARRAALRVGRGRTDLESALQKEIDRANRACAAAAESGDAPVLDQVPEEPRSTAVAVLASRPPARRDEPSPPPADRPRRPGAPCADGAAQRHAADCPACGRRGRVTATALLRRAPGPVLPAALRHRVMHTATDPELAGYRADIAARGGALTPAGLPSQPDVASPFTRRWLFTVGAMTSALAAALVAVFAMGPGIKGDPLAWPPFRTNPQPSITHQPPPQGHEHGRSPSHPPGGGGGGPGHAPAGPGTGGKTPKAPANSAPPSSSTPRPPGVLVVGPTKVQLFGTKTTEVRLSAKSGPVAWTAMTSTDKLVLSETKGDMPANGTTQLTLTLRTAVIGLPGKGTLTFTDSSGQPQTIPVEWGASVL